MERKGEGEVKCNFSQREIRGMGIAVELGWFKTREDLVHKVVASLLRGEGILPKN